MRQREQERRGGRERDEQRAPVAIAPSHEAMLRLQRTAGNAAVGRLIARQPVVAPAPDPVAAPAPAAAEPGTFTAFSDDVKAKIEALKTAEATYKGATGAAKAAAKKARDKAVAAHHTAVLALAGWTRENMPPRAILDGYLDRTDVAAETKVATLGELAAGVARMEFLLGTMYHQGTTAKWETGNTGVFPDTYDAAIGGGAQPWCTKFAGYAYSRLGFQANKKGTTSEFMSGYRLREWSAKGEGVDNKEITAADQTVEDAVGTGSALIDKSAWAQLRKDLKKAKTAEERTTATAAFFADGAHPLPQAGDIVVKPRGDAEGTNEFTAGKSHTMLVESFDAADYKIHTIEGNVGDKVGGRTIDLTSALDVSKIILLTRMGTQFFGKDPTAAGGAGATGTSTDGGPGLVGGLVSAVLRFIYSGELLTGGIHEVNARLVEINAAQGWIQSAGADASVTDWTGATGSGNES
jgi:hypothetical protein